MHSTGKITFLNTRHFFYLILKRSIIKKKSDSIKQNMTVLSGLRRQSELLQDVCTQRLEIGKRTVQSHLKTLQSENNLP